MRGVWNGVPALCHGVLTSVVISKAGLSRNSQAAWTAQIGLRGNGQWQDRNYEPQAGDIIFFDWEGDGETDHVGIVENAKTVSFTPWRVILATLADKKQYTVGSSSIYGYEGFFFFVCRVLRLSVCGRNFF